MHKTMLKMRGGFTHKFTSNIYLAIAVCKNAGESGYNDQCLKGMVMTLVNRDRSPDIGFSFCSILPKEFKVECYDGIGKWVHMLHATEDGRAEECSKAESLEYAKVCLTASLENIALL